MTELGTNDYVLAYGFQSLTQQLLASSLAVAGWRVEEITSRLKRFLNDFQGFIFVTDSPIRVCQLPRTEADLGDLHASITKRTKFHRVFSLIMFKVPCEGIFFFFLKKKIIPFARLRVSIYLPDGKINFLHLIWGQRPQLYGFRVFLHLGDGLETGDWDRLLASRPNPASAPCTKVRPLLVRISRILSS